MPGATDAGHRFGRHLEAERAIGGINALGKPWHDMLEGLILTK